MSSRKPSSHSVGGVVACAPPMSGSVVQSSVPDGARLDDDVVVAELGARASGTPAPALGRRHRRQVDRAGQPHVRGVGVAAAPAYRSPSMGANGLVRAPRYVARRLAGEQRELVRREHVAGRASNAPASSSGLSTAAWPPNCAAAPSSGGPVPRCRRARARRPGEGAQVVLLEVVGQQQAVAEEVLGDGAVLLGGAVEAVVDAAERTAELAVVAGGLAGVQQLPALVEVVAHGHGQVLLALGHRQVLDGPNW